MNGVEWNLVGNAAKHVERHNFSERFVCDARGLALLRREDERRADCTTTIARLIDADPGLADDPVVSRWRDESRRIPHPFPSVGDGLTVVSCPADPAHVNDRIAFAKTERVKSALGRTIAWDAEDMYGYDLAYKMPPAYQFSNLTVLDATSGGGSTPFEALRLGHTVIANELNPVAATILHGTLDYPARFGDHLLGDIEA